MADLTCLSLCAGAAGLGFGLGHRYSSCDMTVLRRDHPERVNWSDPTGQKAMQLPEWQWERIVEMVEYLHVTYGTEGLIRGENGRIIATEERPINHGTRGGYLAHLRRRIPPCRPLFGCEHRRLPTAPRQEERLSVMGKGAVPAAVAWAFRLLAGSEGDLLEACDA